MARLSDYFNRRVPPPLYGLKIYRGEQLFYQQEETLVLLWRQVQKLSLIDWQLRLFVRVMTSFDNVLGQSLQVPSSLCRLRAL